MNQEQWHVRALRQHARVQETKEVTALTVLGWFQLMIGAGFLLSIAPRVFSGAAPDAATLAPGIAGGVVYTIAGLGLKSRCSWGWWTAAAMHAYVGIAMLRDVTQQLWLIELDPYVLVFDAALAGYCLLVIAWLNQTATTRHISFARGAPGFLCRYSPMVLAFVAQIALSSP